jgi:hypothetical protein
MPLTALLSTRNARGYYARESAAVGGAAHPNYLHFGFAASSTNVPLGWVLVARNPGAHGRAARNGAPAAGRHEPVFDNPAKLGGSTCSSPSPTSHKGT